MQTKMICPPMEFQRKIPGGASNLHLGVTAHGSGLFGVADRAKESGRSMRSFLRSLELYVMLGPL